MYIPKNLLIITIFIFYSIPFTYLIITLQCDKYKNKYVLSKTLNSLGFILVSIICGIIGNNINLLKVFLPGFVFCFIGDFVLGLYNNTKEQKYFLVGLFSFLLGHIAFILAYTKIQDFMIIDIVFPIIAIVITYLLSNLKNMHCNKMTPLVCVYSFFVSLLFSKSIHILLIFKTTQFIFLAVGSSLFLISDILILFLYFYQKHSPAVAILNLATYYYGIFFIALSLLF